MKIKIAINTVNNFSNKTLPIVIPSLLNAGIEKSDIYIFEGGHKVRSVNNYEGINYIKTNHNSIDFTALIDIVENEINFDYWFMMHDTCSVGLNFKNLLYANDIFNYQKIALRNKPSMNIGIYNYSYLKKHKDFILTYKNENDSIESLIAMKNKQIIEEDSLLWMTVDSPTGICNMHLPDVQIIGVENFYQTETPRIIEYHARLDLYKYKSNWGQHGNSPTTNL
jgi:hypothetical protein